MDKNLDTLKEEVHELFEMFEFKWSNYVQYVHLVEEVAELGEAITVKEGDRKGGSGEKALADHTDLEEEIGDVLFTLLEISHRYGIDLSQVTDKTFKRYISKLERKNNG